MAWLVVQAGTHGSAAQPTRNEPPQPTARTAAPRGSSGLAGLAHSASPLPTPLQERAQVSVALAQDLEVSLQSLPGVKRARVHLLSPATGASAFGDPASGKASVLLLLDVDAPQLDSTLVRNLVAGAVPHLDAAAVTVEQASTAPAAAPTQATQAHDERTAPTTRWILGAVLLAQVLLAAGTLVLLRRVRSVESLTRR